MAGNRPDGATPLEDAEKPEPVRPPAEIWLDGDVLACACPDCGAPMSIRLWLMLADCWHCGTSLELTVSQQEEAIRLLKERGLPTPGNLPGQPSRGSRSPDGLRGVSGAPVAVPLPEPQLPETPPPSLPSAPQTLPKKRRVAWSDEAPSPRSAMAEPPPAPTLRVPPPPPPRSAAFSARTSRVRRRGTISWLGRLLRSLPAWLISLVFHVVALLLLGLWMIEPPQRPVSIVLATDLGWDNTEGEELIFDSIVNTDELPLPGLGESDWLDQPPSPGNDETLVEDLALSVPNLLGDADIWDHLPNAAPAALRSGLFSGRDPALRGQIALQQGGTVETEAAVARGLEWLARHQNADGSWSLHAFDRAPRARRGEDGLGLVSDTAGTAMALLPFLGAGETHQQGKYQYTVRKGLQWLIRFQDKHGDLRGPGIGQMYAHGQASIALCEAYAMTNDPWLRGPAQQSIDFITRAQHPAGGWRYQPGMAGDTSVLGWQLMALQSARMHYLLRVPEETLLRAGRFLDSVEAGGGYRGGLYGYMPGHSASAAMTAEGLLCRLYLGWPTTHHSVRNGVEYLLREHPPDIRRPNMYYWYYATQVMHHVGGPAFQKWNYLMRPVLLNLQQQHGPNSGSWPPVGEWASQGGRIYTTALAICSLEVYYRYMPLNRKEAVLVGQGKSPQGQPPLANHPSDSLE